MNTGKPKETKLSKLVAVYEHFGNKISDIPDEWAERLAKSSKSVVVLYESVISGERKIRPSEMSSGLEQGLRDTPDLISMVSPQWRSAVAKHFRSAIEEKYPDFLAKDEQRLAKIRERGKIRTDSEYYLVRHLIDVHEGNSAFNALLSELYLLVDTFRVKV